MPVRKKSKNLASQRKKARATALGKRIKPTGSLRRNAIIQVMKREAVKEKGLPASATGRFKTIDYKLAQSTSHVTPASIKIKQINSRHKGPKVAGRSKQKPFGTTKTTGKRGTFQSRKSKRRL